MDLFCYKCCLIPSLQTFMSSVSLKCSHEPIDDLYLSSIYSKEKLQPCFLHCSYAEKSCRKKLCIKRSVVLIILSKFSSFLVDHSRSLRSREDSSAFPLVFYLTAFIFCYVFWLQKCPQFRTLENFSMVWECLFLAPWLWILIALQMLPERGFSMLHFRCGVTSPCVYSVLETWIVISDCHQLIPSSASLSFFCWVFLWALSQTPVGLEFSNQNVMSAHLVIMLCSPGIKSNAAFRAVCRAEEKWANTKPAACLFSTEVMLPDGHPEEALWERLCAGPGRRSKLFLETEKHSDKCGIMEDVFERAMDRDSQDHKRLAASRYKIRVLHWRTCWNEFPTILEEHCL